MEFTPRISNIDDEKEKKRLLQRMENLVQKGKKQGVKVTKEVIKTLEVAPKIEEYSKLRSVDLIIMGSHGRTGLKKFAFGSVANEVAPRSKCPIMIIN
jgi:nucleotide-binding universal stress UspA family protein